MSFHLPCSPPCPLVLGSTQEEKGWLSIAFSGPRYLHLSYGENNLFFCSSLGEPTLSNYTLCLPHSSLMFSNNSLHPLLQRHQSSLDNVNLTLSLKLFCNRNKIVKIVTLHVFIPSLAYSLPEQVSTRGGVRRFVSVLCVVW